jgi:kinetochore protein NNF1
MVSLLGAKCAKEFERILEAREVVRKLNELEELVAQAGRRKGEGEMDGRGAPVP